MPESADTPAWHQLSAADALSKLGSDAERGLDAATHEQRLAEHGRNVLPEEQTRGWARLFLAQFADVFVGVLLAATALSLALGEWLDASAIALILLLNAIIGAVQEWRAERAMEALRELARAKARALRDGRWAPVSADTLVPGDVVAVEAGGVVPADLRVLEQTELRVDESPLTGESAEVSKRAEPTGSADVEVADRHCMLHRGTRVTRGRATALVVATGARTELGRIALMLRGGQRPQTPLQRRLARFSRRLAVVVVLVGVALFVSGVLRGEDTLLMLLTAISLAVAAIPEALPAVAAVGLAMGARRMGRRQALVRRLAAVETLGSVTTICADKTGTITLGEMRVARLRLADGRALEADALDRDDPLTARVLQILALNQDVRLADRETRDDDERAADGDAPDAHAPAHASADDDTARDTRQLVGDATEVALWVAAEAAGVDPRTLRERHPREAELAFDSERKRMSTVHEIDGELVLLHKGAPEVVIPRCREDGAADHDQLLAWAEELADGGHRVLALAAREVSREQLHELESLEQELQPVALLGLVDPPRAGVDDAVAQCRTAGIRPVMITGDHPHTALAIARQVGLAERDDEVLTGSELRKLHDEARAERIARTHLFARVSPEQKLEIVRAYQERGEFVAMTGDGVNDAPALQRAEIGVAMGRTGTDVAREAADMVLLDDDFVTLVAAVREGRRVDDDIRKFIRYALAGNTGELLTLGLAPLFGLPLPLMPIQILWVNLVTDGLPGLALAVEKEEPDVMQRKPRQPGEGLLARGLGRHVAWAGALIGAMCLAVQAWAEGRGSEHGRTLVFTTLSLCQLAHVLVVRSERRSLWSMGLLSNRSMCVAVGVGLLLQIATVGVPALHPIFHTSLPPLSEWWPALAAPLVLMTAVEAEKAWRRAREPAGGVR